MERTLRVKTPPLSAKWAKIGTILFAVLLVTVAIVLIVENVKGGTQSAATSNQVAETVADVFAVDNSTRVVPTKVTFNPDGDPQLEVPYDLNPTMTPANVTDPTLEWTSSNNQYATVADGVVTFHKYGKVTIYARSVMTGTKWSILLNCTPPEDFTVVWPTKIKQYATIYPRCYPLVDDVPDTTAPVSLTYYSWNSNGYFRLGSSGLVALKAGTVTVKVKRGDYEHSYTVTIEPEEYVAPTGMDFTIKRDNKDVAPDELGLGRAYIVRAKAKTGETLLYPVLTVQDTSIVSLTSSTGTLTARKVGTTEIVVTSPYDETVHYSVTITVKEFAPSSITINGASSAGTDRTTRYYAVAQGEYTTKGDRVVWSTSDPKVASISTGGLLTVHRIGKVTIYATSVVDPTVRGEITVQCKLYANFAYWVRKVIGHFLGNGALGFAAIGLAYFGIRKHRKVLIPVTVVLFGAFFAGLGEFLQLDFITTGRYATWEDVLINFVGYLSGAAFGVLCLFVAELVRRPIALRHAPKEPADLPAV